MISGLLALQLAFLTPLDEPRWQLAGAVITATPAALEEGLSLGVAGDVQRRLGRRSFVSARLGWTTAHAANRIWAIEHDQFVAALGLGLAATRGVGRVWAQVGAGATGVIEHLGTNTAFAKRETNFVIGPHLFGELGVALALRGAWRGLLAVGPTVDFMTVNQQGRWRFGGVARLGVAYGF